MNKKQTRCEREDYFFSESSSKNNDNPKSQEKEGYKSKPKKCTYRGIQNKFGIKEKIRKWNKERDIIQGYLALFKRPDEIENRKTRNKAMMCLYLLEGREFLRKERFDRNITKRLDLEHTPLFKRLSLWGKYNGLLEVELDENKKRIIKLKMGSPTHLLLNGFFPNGKTSRKQKNNQ